MRYADDVSCVGLFAGGHVALFGTINAFVHVVMYFYYLLTAVDASYKKSIWWKRHITELQLVSHMRQTVNGLGLAVMSHNTMSHYI